MIRFFADSTMSVTRIMFDPTLHFPSGSGEPHPILIQEHKESRYMLGSFGMTISHLRVLTMFWCATAIIILIHQFVLKPRLWYNQQNNIVGRHIRVCIIVHIILTIRNYVLEYVCTILQHMTLHVCIVWYLLNMVLFQLKKSNMVYDVVRGVGRISGLQRIYISVIPQPAERSPLSSIHHPHPPQISYVPIIKSERNNTLSVAKPLLACFQIKMTILQVV